MGIIFDRLRLYLDTMNRIKPFGYLFLAIAAAIAVPLKGQKKDANSSRKSIKAFAKFYPNTTLKRITQQNMHTSMVNMGENIEMDAVSTTYTSEVIFAPAGDSQTLQVFPFKVEGYISTNGIKQDIGQNTSNELFYVVDSKGILTNIKGDTNYIKALKLSGINNAQLGLNMMVYFKHNKELFLGDSFQLNHKGNPYSFNKTLVLTRMNSEEAEFTTNTTIVLDHNYDMSNYDIHQHVEGSSTGIMKVRLSDYLVTYNEENLNLAGYMEMVSVNIPLTIKGVMKETVSQ